MTHWFRALIGNTVLRSAVASFGLKANAVAFTFALVALVSRNADANTFGTFSMLFSASGLFSIVAVAGQQVLLLRNWSAYTLAADIAHLKGALLYSIATAMGGLLVTSLGFYLVLAAMLPHDLAASATAYLASLCLVNISAHLVRTAVGIFIGDGIGTMAASAPPIIYLGFVQVTGDVPDIETIFWLMAAGGAFAFAVHVLAMAWTIARNCPDLWRTTARLKTKEWNPSSLKLWISQILEVSNQYLDVLVVGLLLDPATAGQYFIITRLANVFGMISAAVYLITTRHVPAAYYAGDRPRLERLLDSVAFVTLIATAAGLLVVLLFGSNLLFIFGDQHEEHYLLLVLLCIGTVLVTATGPAAALLNIAGKEGSYLQALTISVLVRLIGFAVLVPMIGISGAIGAGAVSLALLAALCRSAAVHLTGYDGSVLRLLGRLRGAPAPDSP
jgi:O-antigen/teichoic acid export membrane protein